MNDSVFNPDKQEMDLSSKVVVGLERLSEVFKVLLWEKAKVVGLSPIQIQLLIFIANHKPELCNVSHLAREFNLTKPTISDAVKVLDKKGFIVKDHSSADSRSYTIYLSESGKQLIGELSAFTDPLYNQVDKLDKAELEGVFKTLSELIYKLNRAGVLQVQRTCFGCRFYEKQGDQAYCNLLKKDLLETDIRLDCPEFEEKLV